MSGLVKAVAVLAGILVVLCIVTVVLVKVLVTPEKIRETVLPLAEEQLQRKVELGEIKIGLLSGVSLKDLRVQEKDGSGNFLTVKALELSYQFWPLLSGKVVIDKVLLDEPKISVMRYADGSFNFSDLINVGVQPAKTENQQPEATSERASGGAAIDLLVNAVSLKGGELLFVDRSQNAQSPYRYSLEQLNLSAEQITLDKSFPINFSARLNKSSIELKGRYDLNRQAGNFSVQLTPLDLLQFAPYYRTALPGKLDSALLALDLELELGAEQIDSKGKLTLEQLDLRLNDLPEAQFKQASLIVDHVIGYQLGKQQIEIAALLIDLNGIKLKADGSVGLASDDPDLRMTVALDQFDLRNAVQRLPAGLTSSIEPYSPSGLVNGRVNLAGKASGGAKLLQGANFDLADVQASVNGLRTGVSGAVNYANAALEAKQLKLKLGDQSAELSVKANNLFGKVIRGDFLLTAEQLDINKLLPAGSDQGAVASSQGSSEPTVERVKSKAEDIGPFDIPLDMNGSLSVNKLLYKQLALDQVQADLRLKGNRLQMTKLRSGIAGGELQASTDIDLGVKGLAYQGQMSLSQSNLVTLVAGIVPEARESVSGLLQMQNNFSGRGTIPAQLLQALQLKGALNLQKGKLTGSPLLEQFASFLGSPDLKVLSFNAFSGNYDLRNGLMNLTADLDSSKAKLKPEGTVGVDGALNLSLDARLAPEVMANFGSGGGLQRALTDENGWGMLPLKVKGTYAKPSFGLDEKILKQQAASKAKEEVSKRVLEKIAPKGDSNNEPVRQLLDGTLKKMFGK